MKKPEPEVIKSNVFFVQQTAQKPNIPSLQLKTKKKKKYTYEAGTREYGHLELLLNYQNSCWLILCRSINRLIGSSGAVSHTGTHRADL